MLFLVLQNEEIFVQLDELDELDRITNAWIELITASPKHKKHSSLMVRLTAS